MLYPRNFVEFFIATFESNFSTHPSTKIQLSEVEYNQPL